MFHVHVSEFAELGWMGFFNAVNDANYPAALAEVRLDDEQDFRAMNGSISTGAPSATRRTTQFCHEERCETSPGTSQRQNRRRSIDRL